METYRARYQRTTTWIARHVAQDLLDLHGDQALVSVADEARLQDMEKRDAAIATLPRESHSLLGRVGRRR